MPSGRVDTMSDFLRQIMGSLSEAKLVADADLPFLLELEQLIVTKMRAPIQRMQEAGLMPAGGAPQMQQPQPMPQPEAMPSQMIGAGGVRGVPQGVNPDELRRLLQGAQ